MKQADPSRGFLLCFLANLVLHFWWGVASLILLILHFWMDISLLFAWAAFAFWGIQSMILTAIAYWANRCGQERDPVKQNKNPYSAKTEDLLSGRKGGQDAASADKQDKKIEP